MTEIVADMITVNRPYQHQVAPYTTRAANITDSTYIQTELHEIF